MSRGIFTPAPDFLQRHLRLPQPVQNPTYLSFRRIHHMTQDHTTTAPTSIPIVPNTVISPHLSAMNPNTTRHVNGIPILFHHLGEYSIGASASSPNHRPNFDPHTFHAVSLIALIPGHT
jgi:hypothetical protein